MSLLTDTMQQIEDANTASELLAVLTGNNEVLLGMRLTGYGPDGQLTLLEALQARAAQLDGVAVGWPTRHQLNTATDEQLYEMAVDWLDGAPAVPAVYAIGGDAEGTPVCNGFVIAVSSEHATWLAWRAGCDGVISGEAATEALQQLLTRSHGDAQ